MKPAARLTDMHTCPLATPGTPPIPHVGGPIMPPCYPPVLIGMLPAARVSDMCLCVGPPDVIVQGSPTVFIGMMPAARIGDMTAHGGVIVQGWPTVLIGDSGGGPGGGAPGGSAPGGIAMPSTPASPSSSAASGTSSQTPSAAASPVPAAIPASASAKMKKALGLIRIAGSADQHDAELVANELAKFSDADLDRLKANGSTVVVCRGSVTEYRTDLKNVHPRGWPAGATWDTVPGLHDGNKKEVIIATTGHGTPAGAHVPKTGEGHGSENVVVHETGHALDMDGPPPPLNQDPAFQAARNQDLAALPPYERQNGDAGLQESFAEGLARSKEGKSSNQPNLDNYFKNRP